MMTIEIFFGLMVISLTLIGLSFITKKNNQDQQFLRIVGSVMMLLLGFTMIVTDIVFVSGATVETQNDSSIITYTTTDFNNIGISLTLIIISLALIIDSSVKVFNNRYEEEE